jgi:periplasmic copper chaperone A
MTRFLILPAVALALAACSPSTDEAASGAPGASAVTVADVLCRPTPNGRQVTGCYMTLTASTADTLVSVESPVAALAQIHESRTESNMMMMRELEAGLPLPAGETVELKPGGTHIMLMGVAEPLRAGQTVPLTLTFTTAAPVEVVASVGQPPVVDGEHSGH